MIGLLSAYCSQSSATREDIPYKHGTGSSHQCGGGAAVPQQMSLGVHYMLCGACARTVHCAAHVCACVGACVQAIKRDTILEFFVGGTADAEDGAGSMARNPFGTLERRLAGKGMFQRNTVI